MSREEQRRLQSLRRIAGGRPVPVADDSSLFMVTPPLGRVLARPDIPPGRPPLPPPSPDLDPLTAGRRRVRRRIEDFEDDVPDATIQPRLGGLWFEYN